MKPITVKEAADLLGITYSTARARCNQNGIGTLLGTTRVLMPADLAKLKKIKPKRGRPKK